MQIGVDKLIKLSIQDSSGITGFIVSTMVFDHFVGMEDIASDLVTPASFYSFAFNFDFFRFSLIALQSKKAGIEYFQSAIFVLALGALSWLAFS